MHTQSHLQACVRIHAAIYASQSIKVLLNNNLHVSFLKFHMSTLDVTHLEIQMKSRMVNVSVGIEQAWMTETHTASKTVDGLSR